MAVGPERILASVVLSSSQQPQRCKNPPLGIRPDKRRSVYRALRVDRRAIGKQVHVARSLYRAKCGHPDQSPQVGNGRAAICRSGLDSGSCGKLCCRGFTLQRHARGFPAQRTQLMRLPIAARSRMKPMLGVVGFAWRTLRRADVLPPASTSNLRAQHRSRPPVCHPWDSHFAGFCTGMLIFYMVPVQLVSSSGLAVICFA